MPDAHATLRAAGAGLDGRKGRYYNNQKKISNATDFFRDR
jgi:hypothetical protein